jgi:hypothetical protein
VHVGPADFEVVFAYGTMERNLNRCMQIYLRGAYGDRAARAF